jgi:iron complex transport system substrate-binding protein
MNVALRIGLILLVVTAVSTIAFGAVPGDQNGDKIISQDELSNAENLLKEGKITSDQLEEIKHIKENYPRKVIDSLENEVVIYQPVKSMIILNSNAVELLRSIRAKDKIVGVSKSTVEDEIFFPEFSKFISIGSTTAPDVEKMLELHPDLVIIEATWQKAAGDSLQKSLNESDPEIAIARFDCYRLENYNNETRKIAYLLEKEKEADQFLEFYDDCVNLVVNRTSTLSDNDRPNVYLGYGEFPPFGAYGKSAGAAVRLEMAGGNNIFADDIVDAQYAEVDPEKIITKNPDIIQRQVDVGGHAAKDSSDMKLIWEKTMNQTGWSNINAIKNKRVYMMSKELQNKRYFLGLLYTAKITLPDLFTDMNPRALHQEYLKRFQDLDIDLDNQGVFVYPDWNENKRQA